MTETQQLQRRLIRVIKVLTNEVAADEAAIFVTETATKELITKCDAVEATLNALRCDVSRLRGIVQARAEARKARLSGEIEIAANFESAIDVLYDGLPRQLRW